MTLLPEEMLSNYLSSSCGRANVECTPAIQWIYQKYLILMESTMTESNDSDVVHYIGEITMMLSCVVGRIFHSKGQQQLFDLRKSYKMADMELDESDYPCEGAIKSQAIDCKNLETIDAEMEEVSQCFGEAICRSVDIIDEESATNNIYHNNKANFHVTQLDGEEDDENIIELVNIETSDDRIESNSELQVSNNPNPTEEPRNLFQVQQDRNSVERNTKDFIDVPPEKVHEILPDPETSDYYWNYNIALYERITKYGDISSDGIEVPLGFGLSVGECQLLASSCYVRSCMWNPSEGAKRFMALMHRPWLPGDPSSRQGDE